MKVRNISLAVTQQVFQTSEKLPLFYQTFNIFINWVLKKLLPVYPSLSSMALSIEK